MPSLPLAPVALVAAPAAAVAVVVVVVGVAVLVVVVVGVAAVLVVVVHRPWVQQIPGRCGTGDHKTPRTCSCSSDTDTASPGTPPASHRIW